MQIYAFTKEFRDIDSIGVDFGRVKKKKFALDSESGPVLVFFWRFRAENSEKVGFGTPGPQDTVFHPWPRMAQIVRISANLSLCVEISANEADCD